MMPPESQSKALQHSRVGRTLKKALIDHRDHVKELSREVTHRSNLMRVQKAATDAQRCVDYVKKYTATSPMAVSGEGVARTGISLERILPPLWRGAY